MGGRDHSLNVRSPIRVSKRPRAIRPRIIAKLTRQQVYERLRAAGAKKIFLGDRFYYLTNKGSIERFLKLDDTDKERYVSEFFDCDDYAFRLMGNFKMRSWSKLAIGVAWSMKHAFNIFLDANYIWAIKPDRDVIVKQAEAGPLYKLYLVVM